MKKRLVGNYDGFISYSHAADGKLAPTIQQSLRSLAKPWYRLRALHIFRDETSLTANPALWSSIEKALSQSQWFLYLASPRAAQSDWVRREISWWLSHRGASSLLLALTDGTLRWDKEANEFDWVSTNAIPRELAGQFPSEPLWVDLSWAKEVDQLSLRHSQFRAAILQLAAPLHGRAPEELDGEDVRQYRRTRRTAGGAIAGLATLAVTAVTAAYFAVKRSRESTSRELAMHSIQQLDTDPELSLRLALHALENAETQQAEDALRLALTESKVRLTILAPKQVLTKFSPDGRTIALRSGRVLVLVNKDRVQVLSHAALTPEVEFSRDGKMIATGSSDGKARMWDVASGEMLTEVNASTGEVSKVGLSPDGLLMLAVGRSLDDEAEDMKARIWDTSTGELVLELKGHTEPIVAAEFDPAGKRIFTSSWDSTVRLWDATSGELLQTLEIDLYAAGALAFNPDGDVVSLDGLDLTRRCWDNVTGLMKARSGHSTILERTPDIREHFKVLSPSKQLVLVYEDARATICDPHTGEELRRLADVPGSIYEAVFSDDDRMIAFPGRNGTAFVWDVESGQRIATFRGHRGDVNDVAFSPDGSMLITSGSDKTARIWAIEESSQGCTLSGHQLEVTHAIWSPDGRLVATGSADETARVWDAQTGTLVSIVSSPGRVSSIAFSGDSQRLLVARYDNGGAHVCDARTGSVIAKFTGRQTPYEFLGHADWSPDEAIVIAGIGADLFRWDAHSGSALQEIASGHPTAVRTELLCGYSRAAGLACIKTDSGTVSRIWDVATGSLVSELKDHLNWVMHAAVSPDGRFVALASSAMAEVWETRTGQLRCRLQREQGHINSLDFNPSGTQITTGGGEPDPVARIWDSTSGRLLHELRGHTHSIQSARFSPDGQLIVTASQDNTARVWTVDEGRTIATLRGHGDMIFDARFSSDGRRVLTASADATARIYDVSLSRPLSELIQLAQERRPRDLTAEETTQFLH